MKGEKDTVPAFGDVDFHNIRAPYHVKELIYSYMEEEKRKKWYRRADYFYRGSEWVA